MIDQSSTLAGLGMHSASSAKQGKDIQDGIERIERSVQSTHSVLPLLQRQGEISVSSLHAVHDDVHLIHREMKEHQVSHSGSLATLKTQFEQKISSAESAILGGIDDLACQNLNLMKTMEQFSESAQVRAATLVNSTVSWNANKVLLTYVQESDVKNIQMRLVQKPSLFRRACDDFTTCKGGDVAMSNAQRPDMGSPRTRKTRTHQVCTCSIQRSSRQYPSLRNSNSIQKSWLASMHSENSTHTDDCPHSAWAESSWSLKFRLAYCGRLLARAVEASVSFTKGAGGLSLSPTMRLRCLVAYDSPAFALISEPFWEEPSWEPWEKPVGEMSANDIEAVVNQRVQSLRQMFQERKASPYDMNIHGQTLLHVGTPGEVVKENARP